MGRKFTISALFYFVFKGNFQVQAPREAYIWRDDLTEGFFALRFWEAYIWMGLYTEGLIFRILQYIKILTIVIRVLSTDQYPCKEISHNRKILQ